jgi:hypothetical protein
MEEDRLARCAYYDVTTSNDLRWAAQDGAVRGSSLSVQQSSTFQVLHKVLPLQRHVHILVPPLRIQ